MNGLQRIRIYGKMDQEEYFPVDEFWLLEDSDKASFFVTIARTTTENVRILSYDKMLYYYR